MLLGSGAAGTVNPFDDMSNFSGATRISGTDRIYYSTSGTYSFTDPNGGLSKFRFTVVGGGGASDGDNYGWFANTAGGGGGGVRAEIQTGVTLTIGVGQGGASAGYFSSSLNARDASWFNASLTTSSNGINRVKGRGGESFVKKTSDSSYVLKATGGNTGVTRYHFLSGYDNHMTYINQASSSGYSVLSLNGNRGYFYNGGYGYSYTVSNITVSNPSYHYGGIGGCASHNSSHSGVASGHIHPLDTGSGPRAATAGENTTYSGAGGGGGSDTSCKDGSGQAGCADGAAGGTASGLATLLSGSGITAAGGNGSNYGTNGNAATAGAAGGGYGGNSTHNGFTASWPDSFTAASGIVIVEFLGF